MNRLMAALLAALLLAPTLAVAAPGGGIELITRAEVDVVQKNSKGENVTTRVHTDKANIVPGDTVIYTITYSNKGDQPATNVKIVNPVPENMVYVDKSAEGTGARIEYSIDKGRSYAPLASLKVRTKERERPARATDITDVQWTVVNPVAPGATGSVSYKAKVK